MSEKNVRVKKSVTRNALLNMIKTIMSLAFPLITFPYSARVLGLANVGKVNFASSIVEYFTLLAALGITMYAVREGSKYRDDPEKISRFCNEIFSINIYSMILSMALLVFSTMFVTKLHDYSSIILLLGLRIILNTLSVAWIFSIFEDFSFPTIAACIMEIISISVMLLFVHTPDDLYIYAFSTLIAYNGSGLFMFFYARNYINLEFIPNPSLIHLKPILVIFSLELGMSIYVNSDITVIGWIEGDSATGLYSTAATIYKIMKQVLNALNLVMIPRVSYHVGKELEAKANSIEANENHEQTVTLSNLLINTQITLALPIMTGIYCLAEPLVVLYAGSEFQKSAEPLQLLIIALLFAALATFFGECILMAYKQEKVFMKATMISAIVNFVLNLILIPRLHINAAAYTTIIAEAIMMMITYWESRKYIRLSLSTSVVLSSVVGCAVIFAICWYLKLHIASSILYIIASIGASVIAYAVVLIVLHNDVMWKVIREKTLF